MSGPAGGLRNQLTIFRADWRRENGRASCFLEHLYSAGDPVWSDAVCDAAWLRGREKVQRRALIQVSGCKLGSIIRPLTGRDRFGELRAWASDWLGVAVTPNDRLLVLFVVAIDDQIALFTAIIIQPDPLA